MENGKYTRDELAWMFFDRKYANDIGVYYGVTISTALRDSFKAADIFLVLSEASDK